MFDRLINELNTLLKINDGAEETEEAKEKNSNISSDLKLSINTLNQLLVAIPKLLNKDIKFDIVKFKKSLNDAENLLKSLKKDIDNTKNKILSIISKKNKDTNSEILSIFKSIQDKLDSIKLYFPEKDEEEKKVKFHILNKIDRNKQYSKFIFETNIFDIFTFHEKIEILEALIKNFESVSIEITLKIQDFLLNNINSIIKFENLTESFNIIDIAYRFAEKNHDAALIIFNSIFSIAFSLEEKDRLLTKFADNPDFLAGIKDTKLDWNNLAEHNPNNPVIQAIKKDESYENLISNQTRIFDKVIYSSKFSNVDRIKILLCCQFFHTDLNVFSDPKSLIDQHNASQDSNKNSTPNLFKPLDKTPDEVMKQMDKFIDLARNSNLEEMEKVINELNFQ